LVRDRYQTPAQVDVIEQLALAQVALVHQLAGLVVERQQVARRRERQRPASIGVVAIALGEGGAGVDPDGCPLSREAIRDRDPCNCYAGAKASGSPPDKADSIPLVWTRQEQESNVKNYLSGLLAHPALRKQKTPHYGGVFRPGRRLLRIAFQPAILLHRVHVRVAALHPL
jgi:hypothetical protein